MLAGRVVSEWTLGTTWLMDDVVGALTGGVVAGAGLALADRPRRWLERKGERAFLLLLGSRLAPPQWTGPITESRSG